MRFQILFALAATALAGCAGIPFLDEGTDGPSTTTASVASTVEPQRYEIKDADRGMVRRVRVLLNGRTIDTVVLSKSRSESSSYCCTDDGCQVIEAAKSCSAFKMTCDTEGACKKYSTAAGNGRL
jgi:uncharacterized protein YceK